MKITMHKHLGVYKIVGRIEISGQSVADVRRHFHVQLRWPITEKLDLALLDLECGLVSEGCEKLKKLRKQLERQMPYDDSNLDIESASFNNVGDSTNSDCSAVAGTEGAD